MIDLDADVGADTGACGNAVQGSRRQGPLEQAAAGLVTVVLGMMILLPVIQIVARKLGSSVPGAASYTQYLTLWAGFIGALLASVRSKHLSLSTVNLLPAGVGMRDLRGAARAFGMAVTAAVTALLAYGTLQLVAKDRLGTAILAGDIPQWWGELIMPVSLGAMALLAVWRTPGGLTGRLFSLLACLAMVPLANLAPADAASLLWPGSAVVLLAFLLGAPVFVAMAGMAVLLFYCQGTPIAVVPTNTFQLVTNSTLPAVPLLTVAGYVLAAGGASQRLVAAYRALLGWLPAGMGLMVLAVCVVFTAFTGASGVTILALGGLLLPSLRQEKFPEGFSLGLITAGGSLGLLLPPSLPVILYGVVAEADIKKLYVAGLVPSGMIIGMVAAYTVVVGLRAGAPRHCFVGSEAARALWAAKWDLGLPLLVVGAMVSGVATIVEAAAIAALYALIVEVVIFRNLHPRHDLPQVMAGGASLVGAVLILMGMALGLTAYLVDAQIPDALLEWVRAHLSSQWAFLLALNAILLVLGSVLEMYSAIIVLAPLLVPLGVAFNVDPVHLGIVFLANLELGFILPPMGLNLFLAASRFGRPLGSMYRQALPFLAIRSVAVLLVTYLPAVTTGVIHWLGVE